MSDEPKRIFLGVIEKDNPDETFAVDITADPAVIRAALEQAEEQKRVVAARELERLRKLFHLGDATKASLS